MQEKYYIMANLPICSYFAIDGERHCEVCKNNILCYGDNINIVFASLAAAEKWLAKYGERSVSCRLYDAKSLPKGSQEFYQIIDDRLIKYKYNYALECMDEIGQIAVQDFEISGKTAKFAANFIHLLQYGK